MRAFNTSYIKIMIPLCFFAIMDSGFNSFSTVLSLIAEDFPNASKTFIQMIVTFPSLALIPTALFSGILASYIPKKRIAQGALILMLIGGMIPTFVHGNLVVLFISSACIGLGQGLLMPANSGLIAENFRESNLLTKALGYRQAADYMGSAFITLALGYIARISWYNGYLIYLIVIPLFFITEFFIPIGMPEGKIIGKSVNKLNVLVRPQLLYTLLMGFLVSIVLFVYYTNFSLFVKEGNFGLVTDTSKLMFISSCTGVVAGLTYGYVYKVLGKYTLAVSLAASCLVFFLVSVTKTLPMLYLGSALLGLVVGYQSISVSAYALQIASAEIKTLAIAVQNAIIAAGINSSPVVINFISTSFFGNSSAANCFRIAAIGYAILAICDFIFRGILHKGKGLSSDPV